jgi:hypothetical protein
MGIKRTRKIIRNHRGGIDKKYAYHNEVDWGYTGDYQGENCYKIKDENKRVECAKKKFFFHCKGSTGKSFCSKPPKGNDKNRQNFYRKIVVEDCERDAHACSKTDDMGDPKTLDDMCTYVGVCDDGMPIYEIPSTVTYVYGELKANIDSIFGDWRETAFGTDRVSSLKKKKIKKLKKQMEQIKYDFNTENSDKIRPKSEKSSENDDNEFGESDQQGGSLTTRQLSETKKESKCKAKIGLSKDVFKGALAQYNKYLIEKDALKNAGFSLSRDRKTEATGALTIKGKIQGLKNCLKDFTAGNLTGLKIFQKYLELEEKIAKLKNRKTLKRFKDAFKGLKSKRKAITAQRQALGNRISKKAKSFSSTFSSKENERNPESQPSEESVDSEFD